MAEKKITVDDLLLSDGFVKNGDSGPRPFVAKEDIYKMLHQEGPIKKLTEYGVFSDKKNGGDLEYTGKYIVDDDGARFLMTRTYTLNKEIKNGIVEIDKTEVLFSCPFHSISIDGIERKLYIIRPIIEGSSLNIDDVGAEWNEVFKNKNREYSKFSGLQFIITDYIDKFKIEFDKSITTTKIVIKYEAYDEYLCGGFLINMWAFA